MTLHELSREQARRIAVQAQLLGSSQPTGLVDMVREKYLNPRLRDRILNSAEVQYAEG